MEEGWGIAGGLGGQTDRQTGGGPSFGEKSKGKLGSAGGLDGLTDRHTDAPSSGKASLTLRETGRVVIDVGDYDGDGSGAREATQLTRHVCGLDHHLVTLLALAVKVRHSRPDYTCG